MKKLTFLILFSSALLLSANAQDYKTSLGIRLGVPFGVTVKHFLSTNNAIEGIFASRWGGFSLTGLWEGEHETGKYPALNWYWAAGAHMGFYQEGYNPNLDVAYSGAVFGIDGGVGLEYTFDQIPLNLAIDLLPSINLIGYSGWGGINGALSVRYVF